MTESMKLLIAYDGSPGADVALEDLQRAALPLDVEAVVLCVADLWLLPEGDSVTPLPLRASAAMQEARATSTAMINQAKAHAQSAAERLRLQFPHWQIKAKSVAGSPAWAIVTEAEALNADLIVVGSHGHSRLERLLLGSVSQTVLAQASCTVRIARGRRTAPSRPLRILVGVDGSAEAEKAVEALARRTWPAGTDIRLLMVLDPSLLSAINSSTLPVESLTLSPNQEVDGRIEGILDRYVEIASRNASDVSASKLRMTGDPKRVLVDEAERWGADCIFIGSRGLNRWQRLLLGSVSTAVAARARCPVEVVRSAYPSARP